MPILLAGAIAYSGPFVPSYRSALYADWSAKLVASGLPHTSHASLTRTLADPVQVMLMAAVLTGADEPILVSQEWHNMNQLALLWHVLLTKDDLGRGGGKEW